MNFILRTITYLEGKPPTILNQFLGPHYRILKRCGTPLKEWHNEILKFYPAMKEADADLYKGIIIYSDSFLLEKDKDYYIMTESGETFEKIN